MKFYATCLIQKTPEATSVNFEIEAPTMAAALRQIEHVSAGVELMGGYLDLEGIVSKKPRGLEWRAL